MEFQIISVISVKILLRLWKMETTVSILSKHRLDFAHQVALSVDCTNVGTFCRVYRPVSQTKREDHICQMTHTEVCSACLRCVGFCGEAVVTFDCFSRAAEALGRLSALHEWKAPLQHGMKVLPLGCTWLPSRCVLTKPLHAHMVPSEVGGDLESA